MNFKLIISIGLLLVIGGSVVLLKKINILKIDPKVLVIGTAAGYAPFVSINYQGEYEGFDIDVANALAKQMNKKLVLKDLGSMASLFTALDQGKVDAIIWGISITQDRLQKVAMINYQGDITDSYALIFWKTIPEGVKTISDMKGKIVCVEPASSQESVLSKYNFINKLQTEKVDDALLNIQYGKANAAFVEPAIARKFKNKYSEIQILNIPLESEDQVQGAGIAIKQDNKDLIKQMQDVIATLKSTGVIAKLEQKWNML